MSYNPTYLTNQSPKLFSISYNPTYWNKISQLFFINFLNSYLWNQKVSTIFINILQTCLSDQKSPNRFFFQFLTTLVIGPKNLICYLSNVYTPTYQIKKLSTFFIDVLIRVKNNNSFSSIS